MAETVDTKPVFREAFARRRCLVPIEAFYEWKKLGPKEKQPHALALAGGGFMALAGLWENWKSPVQEWIRSFTIITTRPNELCDQIHDRMPAILPPKAWTVWLGEEPAEPERLKATLAPYPADDMTCWPVSTSQHQEQRPVADRANPAGPDMSRHLGGLAKGCCAPVRQLPISGHGQRAALG